MTRDFAAAPSAPARPTYVFVNSVRFWSMLGVVALHATLAIKENPSEGILPMALECLFKFATIGFFLISGFLLGDRMDRSAPLPYLRRRLKTLFGPWAFWFTLYVLYLVAADLGNHRILAASSDSWLQMIWHDFVAACFSSSFWFVPNLALGMCILLLFRRHLHSVRLGIALFAINAVYIANIYGEWFAPNHTYALFAYVSYLWLGSYAAGNFSRITRWMNSVPLALVILLVLLSYAAALAEAQFLTSRNSLENINTLRPTNQVFSIFVVLLLVKIKSATWPGFLHVRQQTFGVYLVHPFLLRFGFVALNRLYGRSLTDGLRPHLSFAMRGVLFIFSYGGSLLVARSLARSTRWRWLIGVSSPGNTEVAERVVKEPSLYASI